MDKAEQIEVADGLVVQRGTDGHWIGFEADGKHGLFNVENVLHGITKFATIRWIDQLLDRTCGRCGGTGCVDTPFSGSDPSCPSCDGEGKLA